MSTLIQEKLKVLAENHTPVKEIEFLEFVRSRGTHDILENSNCLLALPKGIDLLVGIYESTNLPFDIVTREYNKVKDYTTKVMESNNYAIQEKLEKPLTECLAKLSYRADLMSSEEYLIGSTIKAFESSQEKLFDFTRSQVALEGFTPDAQFVSVLARTKASEFSIEMIKLAEATDDDAIIESFVNLQRIANEYDEAHMDSIAMESGTVYKKIKKAAIAMDDKSRKATQKIRKDISDTQRIKTIVSKTPKRMIDLADQTFTKIKDMDQAARRKAVIEGGITKKALKVLRMAIISGGLATLVTPAVGAIAAIVMVMRSKEIDQRTRNSLVRDLETELRILKEKIRDAEAKNDKPAKYRMMRLEDRLEQEIARIKFGDRKSEKMNYKQLKQGDA